MRSRTISGGSAEDYLGGVVSKHITSVVATREDMNRFNVQHLSQISLAWKLYLRSEFVKATRTIVTLGLKDYLQGKNSVILS